MLPCADGPFDLPLDPVCSPDDFADSYNYREFFLDEPSEPKIKNFARFSGWVRTPQNSASSFSFYINDVRQSHVTFYPRPDVPFGKDMNVFGWWFACEVGQMPSNEHGAFVFRFCEAGFQDEKRYFRLRKKGEGRPPLMFFMHIPKTAGTSLRAAIEGSYEPQKSLFVYDDPMYFHAAGLEYLSHNAFDELKVVCGHFYYGVHKYTTAPYKYVSFLREPYDFLRSFFLFAKFVLRSPDFQGHDIFDMLDGSPGVIELDNCFTRYFTGHFDARPVDEHDYENAISNIERHFAFVGIFERMQESIDKLSAYVGREFSVPFLNKTPETTEKPPIDERFKKAAYPHIKFDLELVRFVQKRF